MSDKEYIRIPATIEGIEKAIERVLSEYESKTINKALDIRKKRRQIIKEFRAELDKRPGESEQIKRELAKKHFGDPDTFYSRVHSYIYQSEKSFFVH